MGPPLRCLMVKRSQKLMDSGRWRVVSVVLDVFLAHREGILWNVETRTMVAAASHDITKDQTGETKQRVGYKRVFRPLLFSH